MWLWKVFRRLLPSIEKIDSWKTSTDRIVEVASSYESLFDANSTVDTKCVLDLWSYKGVHVVRDPRDIVVSSYFSHLHSHPIHREEWAQHRSRLQSVSKEDGLIETIHFIDFVLSPMSNWKTTDNVLEMKFEDLIEHPEKISEALQWMEIDVQLNLDGLDFKSLSNGRERGLEDASHHYRKGVPGDWKNHLTDKVLEEFFCVYPKVVEKWGYE
jgi:hypothetical protein